MKFTDSELYRDLVDAKPYVKVFYVAVGVILAAIAVAIV